MRKHKAPSDKQLKAIALKATNPTMSNTKIAIAAGYSPSTARIASQAIFNKPLVKSWLDNYKYQLDKYDVNPARLAMKLSELLDAEDPVLTMAGPLIDKATGKQIMKPDRKTQLGTVKLIHDVYGVKADTDKGTEGLRRRITLEDFEEKEGIQG